MIDNTLTLAVDSAGTTVNEPSLRLARDLTYTTLYPGGLFGVCNFMIVRDPTKPWQLREGQRLTVRNGLTTTWEGRITSIEMDVRAQEQGNRVTALGYWGDTLMRRTWRKPWADTRQDEQTWAYTPTAAGATKCSVDRDGRIRFTPRGDWVNGDFAAVTYTAPTGETVKRVTFGYDLQQGAQDWRLFAYDPVGATHIGTIVDASGTGTQDITLGTPRQQIQILFQAQANQTAPTDGSVYGQVTIVTVYTETGAINLTEIAKDVRGKVTELSTNETYIGSNTLSLVPFVSDTESLADILMNAAAYGDSSFNPWAVGVRESAYATDNKPVLFAEAYPALTDYDYAVRVDEPNLLAPFAAARDLSEPLANWIGLRYRNEAGDTVYRTPDDDANLKDTDSITAYGERHKWLDIDTTSTTTATNYGRRYLAAHKLPQWRVTSDISVVGEIRGKAGSVPASQIRAGKRVKVENFLSNLSGSGLTLLVTGTHYDADTGVCRLSVGRPDSLDVWLAQSGR